MSTTPDSNDQIASHEYDLHAAQHAISREHNEPHDGFEPVPFWMTLCFAGLLSWGGWYVATYAGDYSSTVMDRPQPKVGNQGPAKPAIDYETAPVDELKKLGARVFNNCISCHQANGEGLPAQFPALNKSEWVVGEQSSPARLARILLYGLNGSITVKGKSYNGQMPAWGAQLKDEQIAAVLTYVRSNWENAADPIRPSVIAAARAKETGRQMTGAQSMTQITLLALPVEYSDPVAASAAPAAKADAKKDAPKKDAPKDMKK